MQGFERCWALDPSACSSGAGFAGGVSEAPEELSGSH